MGSPPAPQQRGVSVLIPAHNEARTIRAVVEGVLSYSLDVTVISDGSTDGTINALSGLPVDVIECVVNAGKGQRLAEGIAIAVARGHSGVLTLDADGQHDPSDIPAFLAAADATPDALVIGQRSRNRKEIPWIRACSIAFGDVFISLVAGQRLPDAQCGMRLYPSSLWEKIVVPPEESRHFVFETAVLLRAGAAGVAFRRVPIAARYRGVVLRPSHYRPLVDTFRIISVVSSHLVGRTAQKGAQLIRVRRAGYCEK